MYGRMGDGVHDDDNIDQSHDQSSHDQSEDNLWSHDLSDDDDNEQSQEQSALEQSNDKVESAFESLYRYASLMLSKTHSQSTGSLPSWVGQSMFDPYERRTLASSADSPRAKNVHWSEPQRIELARNDIIHNRFYSRFCDVIRKISEIIKPLYQDEFVEFIKKHVPTMDLSETTMIDALRALPPAQLIVFLAISIKKHGSENPESILRNIQKHADNLYVYYYDATLAQLPGKQPSLGRSMTGQ